MPTAWHGTESADPAAFTAAARDALAKGQRLQLRAGDAELDVDADTAAALLALVEAAAEGQAVELTALPAELTTGQAADLLGVSRPTVVSLVDRGLIPAARVGTHRRLRTVDVLSFRDASRQQRRQALADVVAISDDLGLYDTD